MTSDVGGNCLLESVYGPRRRLRYHEHNAHKVTKSQILLLLGVPPRPPLTEMEDHRACDSDRRVTVNNIQVILVYGRRGPGDLGGGTETPAASVPRARPVFLILNGTKAFPFQLNVLVLTEWGRANLGR